MPKVLKMAASIGATTNMTCGHHLHLSLSEADQNPRHLKSLVNLVYRYEPLIYGLVAPSRRNCGYALPLPVEKVQQFQNSRTMSNYRSALMNYDRRTGLNLTNCLKGPSSHVELRFHQGTLKAEKSRAWILLWLQLLEYAICRNCRSSEGQLPNTRTSVERFLISCGFRPNSGIYRQVDPELRATGDYILNRWKHFNGKISLKVAKEKERAAKGVPPQGWDEQR